MPDTFAIPGCPISIARDLVETEEPNSSVIVCFDMTNLLPQVRVSSLWRVPREDLHVTLLYLGEIGEISLNKTRDLLAEFASQHAPIQGIFNGIALFSSRLVDTRPLVLLFDSPELPAFRYALCRALESVTVAYQAHGFTAHCTVAQVPEDSKIYDGAEKLSLAEVECDTISLWYGDIRLRFRLNGSTVEKEATIKDVLQDSLVTQIKGGQGSGNFGHAGRPGHVGGSAPKGGINRGLVPKDFQPTPEQMMAEALERVRYGEPIPETYQELTAEETRLTVRTHAYHPGIAPEMIGKGSQAYFTTEDWESLRFPFSDEQVEEMNRRLEERRAVVREKIEQYHQRALEYIGFSNSVVGENAKPGDVDQAAKALIAKLGDFRGGGIPTKEQIEDAMFRAFHKEADKYTEDTPESRAVWDRWMKYRSGIENAYEFSVQAAISRGVLPVQEALGYMRDADKPRGSTSWEELPDELYHVTVAGDAVMQQGLKSRYELRGTEALEGVGGADYFSVSTTASHGYASVIERAFHEAHLVATGALSLQALMNAAEAGGGGVGRNWVERLPSREMHFGKYISDLVDRERAGTLSEEDREAIFNFYTHDYMSARGHAGGYENPVLWGAKRSSFASMQRSQIKIMVLKPRRKKAKGYYLDAEREYRIVGASKAVRIVRTEANFAHMTPEELMR